MGEKTLFDIVIDYYARHRSNSGNVPLGELSEIKESFKHRAAQGAIPWIEKEELEKAKARVDEEVKSYKRKAFQTLKRSIIIEAILVAFFVGIIVNQVTNVIPELWYCCLGAIVISLIVCVLLIMLVTSEPKE